MQWRRDSNFLNLVCAIVLVTVFLFLLLDGILRHMRLQKGNPDRGTVVGVHSETSAIKRYKIPKE